MTMKFLLPLSTAVLLAAGVRSAQAQTEFGLKAGVNFPSYSYTDSEALAGTASIVRFYLTGYLDARIASGFYLHPEVSLQAKGSKLTESTVLGSGEVIQKTMWLDFPFNFLGKLPVSNNVKIFAGGGPYIGFAMDGTNTYADSGSESAIIIYDDNALKSVDYGINFLMGVKLEKRLSLNANYRLGLANIAESNYKWSSTIKNRVFSLGIGVAL